MTFNRYDVIKATDRYSSFLQQARIGNAIVGKVYTRIHTPTKRRGNHEDRKVVIYCSDKMKEYLLKRLESPQTNKILIKERLLILEKIIKKGK